jgi:hypothetical protein
VLMLVIVMWALALCSTYFGIRLERARALLAIRSAYAQAGSARELRIILEREIGKP